MTPLQSVMYDRRGFLTNAGNRLRSRRIASGLE
jgi:hypothetical protein